MLFFCNFFWNTNYNLLGAPALILMLNEAFLCSKQVEKNDQGVCFFLKGKGEGAHDPINKQSPADFCVAVDRRI